MQEALMPQRPWMAESGLAAIDPTQLPWRLIAAGSRSYDELTFSLSGLIRGSYPCPCRLCSGFLTTLSDSSVGQSAALTKRRSSVRPRLG